MFKDLHRPVTVSPTVSASMMQAFRSTLPIFLDGFLRLFHDSVFYDLLRFRPVEQRTGEPGSAAQ